jgi:RNA polymerase sigma factor (sigma-70 family)
MPESDDHQLIAEYARAQSEPAFAALVSRHINLVYSTAVRHTGNAHHAQEITQAVFVILAQKAGKLSPRVVLSGWLYQAARLTAANFMKGEARRQRREQEAYMEQSALTEPNGEAWHEIAPMLDEAMGGLGETDRNAVVLRYFENKTAAEVAASMKLTEAAVHKRVGRALEKLRKFFTKRGVGSTTAIIAGAISVNSVHAAPPALAKAVTAVAITKGAAASASTLTLIKGALKVMAWIKLKTAIISGIVVVLSVGTIAGVDEGVRMHSAAEGKQILAKVIEANRYWLLAPPDSVKSYSYVFHLDWAKAPGGVINTPVHVGPQHKATANERQATTYFSVLQQLARHPELVQVQRASEVDGKIRLTLKFSYAPGAKRFDEANGQKYPLPPLRIECGNGLGQNWRGYFSNGSTNAELVVDAEKLVPLTSLLKMKNGTVEESFSDYTEVNPGSYVPLTVTIKNTCMPAGFDPMEFAWQFKLNDNALWLLDQSEYRGKKVAWTDQVAVNQP